MRLCFATLCLLLACGPSALPRTFRAGTSCPFDGSAFGMIANGGDVVLSLFELDALQQLRLSDCKEQRRWDVAPGPRALISLGDGYAATVASALAFASADGGAAALPTAPAPTALIAADLDGDGTPEVLATAGSTAAEAKVIVVRSFAVQQELALSAASALVGADLDGDLDLDVLVARTTEHRLNVLTNTAGVLSVGPDIPVCDEPFALTMLGPAIVVTCRKGGLEVLRPEGTGYTRQALAREGTLYQTVVEDFDRDGHLDLASVDPFAHTLVLWWGKPGGQFDGPVEQATSRGPIVLRASDFDRDGRLDLWVLAFQDRSVTVFRNEGFSR